MRHQPDLPSQERCHTKAVDATFQDLASALAVLAFCAAVAFVLMATIVPELPA